MEKLKVIMNIHILISMKHIFDRWKFIIIIRNLVQNNVILNISCENLVSNCEESSNTCEALVKKCEQSAQECETLSSKCSKLTIESEELLKNLIDSRIMAAENSYVSMKKKCYSFINYCDK